MPELPSWHHLPPRHLCPGLMTSWTYVCHHLLGPSCPVSHPSQAQVALAHPPVAFLHHSFLLWVTACPAKATRRSGNLGGRVYADTGEAPDSLGQMARAASKGCTPVSPGEAPDVSVTCALCHPTPRVSPTCCLLPPRGFTHVGGQSALGGMSLQGSTAGQ